MSERTRVLGADGRLRRGNGNLAVGFLAIVAILTLVASVGWPGTALAENSVTASEPANGATIAESPAEIQITFNEELGETNTIAVTCNSELFTVGPRQIADDGVTLSAEIVDPLPRGTCIATWAVSDTDGNPNGDGNITFAVQNDSAAAATTVPSGSTPTSVPDSTDGTAPDTTDGAAADGAATAAPDQVMDLADVDTGKGPLWLGRLLSILGIAVVFGSLVVIAAAWPEGVEYLLAIRFIRAAWLLAFVGTLLYVAAATAAVTGTGLGSGFNPANWVDLFDAGIPGIAAIARLVLVVAMAYVAFRPDRVIDPVTQLASLGIPALAVVTLGLSRTDVDLPIVSIPMAVIHALAMSVWIGGVVLLARVVLAGPGEEDLVHAVRGFSRISNVAIGATVLSGIVQMILLDGGDLFGSSHGQVVLLKTVVVAVMIFVAVSARQFVHQRLARANDMSIPMADRLRRAFGVEALAGVVVLALSAWLLALTPPNTPANSSVSYAVERRFQSEEAQIDVTVELTTDRVGVAGMRVTVDQPESGLSALEVVLTAPANDTVGGYTQPVPLTGPGVAVLPATAGMPLSVPGDWTINVNGVTPTGVYQSEAQGFTVLNTDGTTVTTPLTVPPQVIVTIPETTPAG